jgi:hypothetical protein
MDKITTAECNRVVAILEDSVERLMLLSYVPEGVHESILSELEAAPYEAFSRHWDLERRSGAGDPPSRELTDSSRNICRILRDSPKTFGILQRYSEERPEAGLQFISHLLDLKTMFGRKLAKTNEDEGRYADSIAQAQLRTKAAEENRVAVERCMEAAGQSKMAELAASARVFDDVRGECVLYETRNEATRGSFEEETTKKLGAIADDHAALVGAGTKLEGELKGKLSAALEDGVNEELVCRRKRNKLELELQESMARYDERMLEMSTKIADLTSKYEVERSEFEELREYFDMMDKDKAIEDEEEAVIAAQKKIEDEKHRHVEKLIMRIQAVYRGRVARAAVVDKGKGKKGKKGKGKKGKK